MTKRSEYFFVIICGALVIALASILVFSPVKSFSEKENRALAGAPSFRLHTFFDGEFLDELSDFCTDQFPFREYLTDLKAKCEMGLGKRENNGVFITESSLIDLHESEHYEVLEQNLAALGGFADLADRNRLTFICAPRSVDISALPFDASFSQNRLYSRISSLDIASPDILTPLRAAQESGTVVWYATDHHWTTRGAYIAYRALMESWNMSAYDQDFFDVDSASHSFLGTTYSKSGITYYTPDSIYLYRYDGDEDFEIEYVGENKIERGFYDFDKLKGKDKYAVFLGGNFAHIRIRQGESDRPKLLLIKDSFANSVIPFLALHFDIDVIDPRYLTAPLDNVVNTDEYDKILILCGADTLATDAGFGKWIEK